MTVATYTKNEKIVKIQRVVKEGTKRVFFYPVTSDDKRLSKTNFGRMYDAVNLGNRYLNR